MKFVAGLFALCALTLGSGKLFAETLNCTINYYSDDPRLVTIFTTEKIAGTYGEDSRGAQYLELCANSDATTGCFSGYPFDKLEHSFYYRQYLKTSPVDASTVYLEVKAKGTDGAEDFNDSFSEGAVENGNTSANIFGLPNELVLNEGKAILFGISCVMND